MSKYLLPKYFYFFIEKLFSFSAGTSRLVKCLLLALLFSFSFAGTSLTAQNYYEDDFDEDNSYQEKKQEKKNSGEDKKTDTKTDQKSSQNLIKKDDKKQVYEDDFEEDQTVDEEAEALRKQRELEKQRRQEELRKKQAEAEQRIQEQREKEEQRRLQNEQKKKQAFQEKSLYRDYYLKKFADEKIPSRMNSRLGFAFAVNLGYHPNLGNSSEEGFSFDDYFGFLGPFFDNFQNADHYLNPKSNKGLAHIANGFQTLVFDMRSGITRDTGESLDDYMARLEKKASLYSSSASLDSFPLGVNLAHYSEYFVARLGINFHWSLFGLGGTNQYDACSGFLNNCTLKDSPENAPLKADDVHYYVKSQASMMRLELPLSLAVKLLSSRAYGAYLGGGVNLSWGRNVSEIESDYPKLFGSDKIQTEKDVYSAWGIGFHFLLGIEAQIKENLYLTVEIFQSFGQSNLVNDSDVDENEVKGIAEALQLNFGGSQIILGLRWFL